MNQNHLHLACDAETALPILRGWFDNPVLDIDGIAEDTFAVCSSSTGVFGPGEGSRHAL